MREQILTYLRQHGPSVPATIASSLRKESVFVNAVLSELINEGKILLTDMKYGRSRLHYLAGQEAQLDAYVDTLNEKDAQTARRLKAEGVLRDSSLEPLTRVSLRNIPDFAVPLEVTFNQRKELFWKWHVLSSDEAVSRIKRMLGITEDEMKSSRHAPEEMRSSQEGTEAPLTPHDGTDSDAGSLGETSEKGDEEYAEGSRSSSEEDETKEDTDDNTSRMQDLSRYQQESEGVYDSSDATQVSEQSDTDDPFGKEVIAFLNERNIRVMRCEVIRKGTDIDLEVMVPSPVGELRYYCKARKKKSIDDGDLSAAYVTALMRRLPALFVTSGKLTRKAQEKCEHEMLSMSVVEMG